MTLSLFAATIPPFVRMLTSVEHLLAKAEAHAAAQGIAPEELIEARLAPDMLPFAYQVKSTAVHSQGAIEGVRRGVFSPDRSEPGQSFAALGSRVGEPKRLLGAVTADEIDALEGNPMRFEMGQHRADFTAENFLLHFSLPNFYFHATTAYDILRMKGVAIGKVDYLGQLPLVRV